MDKRLCETSVCGIVDVLNALIQEDPLILHRLSVITLQENPLHIAAKSGHLNFLKKILSYEPKLASELDSMGRSPLHLASIKGYVDIVGELVLAYPDAALVRDQDGRMPIHLAAKKGRLDVIQVLFEAKPETVKSTVGREETILHLCVKNNRIEALKKSIELIGQNDELIERQDNDGNTILHVAASLKQDETIEYLVSIERVKRIGNVPNKKGMTPIDLAYCQRIDPRSMNILDILTCKQPESCSCSSPQVKKSKILELSRWYDQFCAQYIESNQNNLMVVATLIATIAFQTGINPPGGVWQEFAKSDETMIYFQYNDDYNNLTLKYEAMESFIRRHNMSHIPGSPVLWDVRPKMYDAFIYSNNISLVSSLGIIFLMMSGFPLKNKFGMWLLVLALIVSVAFTATTYATVITGLADLKDIEAGKYWSWLDTGFKVTQHRAIVIPIVITILVEMIMFSIHTVGLFAWSIINFFKLDEDNQNQNHC